MASTAPPKVPLKDTISLCFMAFVEKIPPSISIKSCTLEYVGGEPRPGFLTGVYGSHSKQQALVSAAKWNKAQHAKSDRVDDRVLMVDVGYRVDNFILTRHLINEESLAKTGWLHLERLAAGFRDEIKAEWLEWIAKDINHSRARALEDTSLADLALQYPRYVMRMMKENPHVTIALHPVRPVIDPDAVVWAATVRYDKARFHSPSVRYLDQIKVVV